MATVKADKRITAFLDLIAWSEGTTTHPLTKCDGYDVIVTGVDGLHTFTDFSTHPFALGRAPILVRPSCQGSDAVYDAETHKLLHPAEMPQPALHSTASGRYQFILPSWQKIAARIFAGTFSPANQDMAAIHVLHNLNAVQPILGGYYMEAVHLCSEEWASFPGNLFGQPVHTEDELTKQYNWMLDSQEE